MGRRLQMVHPASLVTIEFVVIEHIGELEMAVPTIGGETVAANELTFGNSTAHSYPGFQVDLFVEEASTFAVRS